MTKEDRMQINAIELLKGKGIVKTVWFKIEGEEWNRTGPCLEVDTEKSLKERLSKVFNVDKSKINIHEIN